MLWSTSLLSPIRSPLYRPLPISSRDSSGRNDHKNCPPCHVCDVSIPSRARSHSSIKGTAKNCSQFPSKLQCMEHSHCWQLWGGGKMCCLYPFLIAGDCKVVLQEINTLLLSSPTCSMPAHLVYRWPFNNNFQYRNFFNCLFRFLLQTTVVGLLMGKAEQMDFVWCVSAERKNERAQNHLNDKSNLKKKKKKSISLCAITFYLQPGCHKYTV